MFGSPGICKMKKRLLNPINVSSELEDGILIRAHVTVKVTSSSTGTADVVGQGASRKPGVATVAAHPERVYES
jgi:hypothetical protein